MLCVISRYCNIPYTPSHYKGFDLKPKYLQNAAQSNEAALSCPYCTSWTDCIIRPCDVTFCTIVFSSPLPVALSRVPSPWNNTSRQTCPGTATLASSISWRCGAAWVKRWSSSSWVCPPFRTYTCGAGPLSSPHCCFASSGEQQVTLKELTLHCQTLSQMGTHTLICPPFSRSSASDCCGEQTPEKCCDLQGSVHHCLRRPERSDLFLSGLPDRRFPKEKTLHNNNYCSDSLHCFCPGGEIMSQCSNQCSYSFVLLFCCVRFSGDDHKTSGGAIGCEEEEESSAYCQWGDSQPGEELHKQSPASVIC